jgi:molybdopterin-containing oxidoreductase family membrane subunit
LSIPWGFAVHTVTAFFFSGLPGRPFWYTTILAPRFLASAFATSSALLILICLALRRLAHFDAGEVVIGKLGVIMTYALTFSVFFVLPELFTTLYARVPDQLAPLTFLYIGLNGQAPLAPFMWLSAALLLIALIALLTPKRRGRENVLAFAAVLVLVGVWLDKGFGFIVAGFAPTPFGAVPAYAPTVPEWAIVGGIWGIGALIVTLSYRVALGAREAV